MRWVFIVLFFAANLCVSRHAVADDPAVSGDLARAQLARVIAVLQLRPDAAGQSCLDTLHEVHHTEDQLKVLQDKTKNPDLALAQDVLETDYENGNEICGADASHVCAGITGAPAKLVAACGALHGSH